MTHHIFQNYSYSCQQEFRISMTGHFTEWQVERMECWRPINRKIGLPTWKYKKIVGGDLNVGCWIPIWILKYGLHMILLNLGLFGGLRIMWCGWCYITRREGFITKILSHLYHNCTRKKSSLSTFNFLFFSKTLFNKIEILLFPIGKNKELSSWNILRGKGGECVIGTGQALQITENSF